MIKSARFGHMIPELFIKVYSLTKTVLSCTYQKTTPSFSCDSHLTLYLKKIVLENKLKGMISF